MKAILFIITLASSSPIFASQIVLDCITDDWNNDTKVALKVYEAKKDFMVTINVEGEMIKPVIRATGHIDESEVKLSFEDNRGFFEGKGFAGIYPLIPLSVPEKGLHNLEMTCSSDLF